MKHIIVMTLIGMMVYIIGSVPAFSANGGADLAITGNGSGSENSITLHQSESVATQQSNTANISNDVFVNNNTGGNTANGNTGGNANIITGSISSTVGITNNVNSNIAQVNSCGNCPVPNSATPTVAPSPGGNSGGNTGGSSSNNPTVNSVSGSIPTPTPAAAGTVSSTPGESALTAGAYNIPKGAPITGMGGGK